MNMMKSTDSLITKFISYFSNVFNEKFFIATEKLLLDLTSLTIPTATIIGFFISLVIAIKTDSLTNFGAGFAWILLIVIFHFIGGRFLNNNLLMIKNNPNTISNKDILDVYSISLIALLIGIIIFNIFLSIKISSLFPLLNILYIGLPVFFITILFLNPKLVSLNISGSSTAGEDALSLLSLGMKILMRLSVIFFGLAGPIGGLFLLKNLTDILSNNILINYFQISSFAGAPILAFGLIYPFFIYIVFIATYLSIDLMKSILSINNSSKKS
jgi:hypothetical protein